MVKTYTKETNMNLSPSTIISYFAAIVCLVLLTVGFGMQAGVVGLFIMGLSFYIGATTEATAKK